MLFGSRWLPVNVGMATFIHLKMVWSHPDAKVRGDAAFVHIEDSRGVFGPALVFVSHPIPY
jgi:hypothetical protein